MRSRWKGFLAVGIVLAAAGVFSVLRPEISTFAAGTAFGIALALAGAVKMIQSLQVKDWGGFVWQELTGAVELVGGILIYLNPLKGVLAIALLAALIMLVQGVFQMIVAFKTRKQPGAYWYAAAGLVSLLASVALAAKVPRSLELEPGVAVGLALLIAGAAHLLMAFAVRQSPE